MPNSKSDGCYINYPDVDAESPYVNKSGVLWSRSYHKGNHPRLQRVTPAYDHE